ncbi:MAG TPA: hypothetical protein VJG83_02940 [archaeon]|nr:hypothetical protein [archaeon]
MISEFHLLKLNPENGSTKNKIISILSSKWPLTAKQIYSELVKEYSGAISYQGVHKIIKDLLGEGVIERKENTYLLNVEWIQKSKRVLENVEKRYLENGKIKIPGDFHNAIQLEFNSVTELSISTAELLLSRQLTRNNNRPDFICTLEYGWWPFKFRFEDFLLLQRMLVQNPKSKNIIRTKTSFGKWIREQYNRIAAVSAPIGSKIDIDEELFVQGDCIIEVRFDEESKKMIEFYYNKWKNIEDIFREFGLKDEPKIRAVMRITKNPQMADFLRKQMEKVFE